MLKLTKLEKNIIGIFILIENLGQLSGNLRTFNDRGIHHNTYEQKETHGSENRYADSKNNGLF